MCASECPRILDLSTINPETIKRQNEKFWKGNAEYNTVDHWDPKIRNKIWNTRNGDLRKVLRNFPFDKPLEYQCAGWVHAIAGRHFFPDANHRTAIALLRTLLKDNGFTPGHWRPDITRKTSLRSHEVRREIENVSLNTLYREDKMFLVWLLYFKTVLRGRELREDRGYCSDSTSS